MTKQDDLRAHWASAISHSIFPDVDTANEFGVIAVGGQLSVTSVLNAYANGIFPWPLQVDESETGRILGWFSPDPRAVLRVEDLHIPRRLRRKMRSSRFKVTSNKAFDAVIAACGAARQIDGIMETETWITGQIKEVYCELHAAGMVHSVEVWEKEVLVGGLYGISVGQLFCGESMFYRVSDASRIGLCRLVQHLGRQGYVLLDLQQTTPHCTALGGSEITRAQYIATLNEGLGEPCWFGEVTC